MTRRCSVCSALVVSAAAPATGFWMCLACKRSDEALMARPSDGVTAIHIGLNGRIVGETKGK